MNQLAGTLPETADPHWIAEHWPFLLGAMLVVFGILLWKRRDR